MRRRICVNVFIEAGSLTVATIDAQAIEIDAALLGQIAVYGLQMRAVTGGVDFGAVAGGENGTTEQP